LIVDFIFHATLHINQFLDSVKLPSKRLALAIYTNFSRQSCEGLGLTCGDHRRLACGSSSSSSHFRLYLCACVMLIVLPSLIIHVVPAVRFCVTIIIIVITSTATVFIADEM